MSPPDSAARWCVFVAFCLLGLFATLPLGALLGALVRNVSMLWTVGMGVYVALAISGVFYPLTALPGWLQVIGRALPTYWVGHGLRAALLPDAAAALEPGGHWQVGPAALVLLGWAVVGFAVAVPALRVMARRQSGSVLLAARERLLARGY